MDNALSSLPGYKLYEYMLVLQPHEELWNKIMHVKKEFAEKFDAASATGGRPQILLARFTQLLMMEERIINRLKMIAMGLPAFKIELKDYGSLPSHSIFIQVDTPVPLQMVIKHLKTAQLLLKTKEHKPQFMSDFYINIARQLLPWQYEKGWLEWSHRHFTGRFVAKNMLLLRRPAGEKQYKTIQSFDFMNMPVVTTQGQLF